MTQFVVNQTRRDPYKNFKFRLKWDGVSVAGFNQVSLPAPSTPAPETLKSPGRTKYEAITLERGVTYDTGFQNWALTPPAPGNPTPPNAANLHRDLTLELFNEASDVATTYTIHGSWVSEYQALPNLNSIDNSIVIQHIKLENEGWTK
ncbi:phage tail protein [Granulicella sp. 5B5]|uniref:phage tail protein n=1 Tax=Granulicella sp. 5B5 TaxID=1617967 RepID=UPI0015F7805F|nr:phage tail protein [Granulicella sp. 5B5]QMV20377.1 phage tail protein [Granulicella sp. 5B5]